MDDSGFVFIVAIFALILCVSVFIVVHFIVETKQHKKREHYDSVNTSIFSSDFRIKAPERPKQEFKEYEPDLSKNTGYDYEVFCASLLKDNDYYDIEVTPKSGDFGADIVATDEYGDRWVFQCKYYKSKVSNSAVQEVVSSMAHYKAVRAGLLTNSTLTEPAMILAKENNVMVVEKLGGNIDFSLIKDELTYK